MGAAVIYDQYAAKDGRPCSGAVAGLPNITEGAQVVVSDDEGRTIAVAELRNGQVVNTFDCAFNFRIEDVPAGKGFYSVVVADEAEKVVSEEDMQPYVVIPIR